MDVDPPLFTLLEWDMLMDGVKSGLGRPTPTPILLEPKPLPPRNECRCWSAPADKSGRCDQPLTHVALSEIPHQCNVIKLLDYQIYYMINIALFRSKIVLCGIDNILRNISHIHVKRGKPFVKYCQSHITLLRIWIMLWSALNVLNLCMLV
jgi:hypothetical protein